MIEYSKYFQEKVRVNQPESTTFVCLVDDKPEKLQDLVRFIHLNFFDSMPDDWIYRQIKEAFEYLEENDGLEDLDLEADVYHSTLLSWMQNHYAAGYCNEALEEYPNPTDIFHIISLAQYRAKSDIYNAVNDFLMEQKDEDFTQSENSDDT